MTPDLLLNAAWGVTLWTASASAAVLLMRRCPAVMRRNACRLALIGTPLVLLGAIAMRHCSPSSGLLLRAAGPARPVAETAMALPSPPAVPIGHVADEFAAGCAEGAPDSPATAPPPPAGGHEPRQAALAVNWRRALPAGILGVAGGCVLLLAIRLLRLASWRRTWRAAPPAWRSLTRRLARRVGMKRPFSVFVAPGLSQPAAGGLFRGAIILPDRSPRSLGPGLRSALAHELGHLDGCDPLWYVLGRAVVALAWWCPLVWWLQRRARMESELAADDHALACGVRPIDLAKTLARFAEWNLRPTPAGISGMTCHLTRRIEMIMDLKQSHRSRPTRRSHWLVALAASLVGLAVVSTPLVGVARAAEDKDVLARPPVVRQDERGEGEGRRELARGEGEGGEGAERRERRREREEGEGEGWERRREREGGEERRRDRERREGEGRLRLPREIAEMAKAVKITNAQEQEIRKQLEAKEQAIGAWRRDNAARLREAELALRKAQEALRRLRAEQEQVARAGDARILAVFTPQQRATWQTTRIVRMYDRRHAENPLVLTNRQLDDIDVLCEKAVKELVAAESKPKAEAEKAGREILYNLQKKIYEDVLDADQRTRAPRPRGLPGREGRGEGERPRREGEAERRREGEGEGRERRRREDQPERRREGEGEGRERPREEGDQRVERPPTSPPKPLSAPSRHLVIDILQDGSIKVGPRVYSSEELGRLLGRIAREEPGRMVLIRVDRKTLHKYFADVVRRCKESGIKEVKVQATK